MSHAIWNRWNFLKWDSRLALWNKNPPLSAWVKLKKRARNVRNIKQTFFKRAAKPSGHGTQRVVVVVVVLGETKFRHVWVPISN